MRVSAIAYLHSASQKPLPNADVALFRVRENSFFVQKRGCCRSLASKQRDFATAAQDGPAKRVSTCGGSGGGSNNPPLPLSSRQDLLDESLSFWGFQSSTRHISPFLRYLAFCAKFQSVFVSEQTKFGDFNAPKRLSEQLRNKSLNLQAEVGILLDVRLSSVAEEGYARLCGKYQHTQFGAGRLPCEF